jgi:mono/diheme cytochrome c family protein
MKRLLLTSAAALLVLVALGALFIGSGIYNVAADEPHTALVHRLLESTRERSIATRADDIDVPDLKNPEMARRGAGNYDAMCVDCHLAPGTEDSELSVGLNPTPPNLAKHAHIDAAEAFWVIKHGIKATGMPAWGKRMEDSYIWDLVAFLRVLPSLSPQQYAEEVAASGGHSHGGGESADHDHEHEQGEHHEEESEAGHAHDEPASGHSHDEEPAEHSHDEKAPPHSHEGGHSHAHPAETQR